MSLCSLLKFSLWLLKAWKLTYSYHICIEHLALLVVSTILVTRSLVVAEIIAFNKLTPVISERLNINIALASEDI
jgi:hypothetical protein